ncbi:4'-phosphopantetheinyl transferase family protein [Bacillus thuringiensis]|uniref:4'-phosphopantetheinyl transferase superfamily protein n=1 Tax=Bacillus thuringiensis TaxID=1428 RepID=A0A9W3VHK9_BACTU|nr:4'-phosphopantetheinyl transferase superfamily protein [Bacillus thuringiensis]AMR06080.1 hypothetical protein AXW78_28885 [Bacillus thuringiensis]AYF85497.1 4'-phosphopantetheinyl transferase superfamily protein [Bacillus thuringiensis]PNK34680.1 hypothetical protein CBR55_29015 [Bacillus thuringiensis]
MSQIHAIKVPEEMVDADYEKLVNCVSASKKEKLSRYFNKSDAYRSLLGDLLVRVFIWDNFLIPNNQITLSFNKYEKPVIDLGFPFSFNISHSKDWVVCIFDNQEVGVDIEQMDKVNLDLVKSYFSQTEYEDLIILPEPMRTKYFFNLWTLKESYIKCIGTGLNCPLNSFTIRINGSSISCMANDNILSPNLSFKLYHFDSSYSLAACANSILPDNVTVITFEELIGRI